MLQTTRSIRLLTAALCASALATACTDDGAPAPETDVAGASQDAGADVPASTDTPAPPPTGSPGNVCPETLASEPPCNPALAEGPWSSSHRSSYAQGSSPLEAPRPGQPLDKRHVYVTGIPTTFAISDEYADGGRAIWASPISSISSIVKLDASTLEPIDEYVPAEREEDPPAPTLGVSGAYNMLDRDGRFLVARARGVEVFGDEVPGGRSSRIVLLERFTLPESAFCGDDDVVVGVTMTYDGHVAFATAHGVVGVVPRDPAQMVADAVAVHWLNDPALCNFPDEREEVSNSIAADESGGIYVVTSEAMYRIDQSGATLSEGWRAPYQAGEPKGGVRLGDGSGSTPSLMGTRDGDDRFVVLTDGQELMHLVLMWRDEPPADWVPIAPGRDPRIACEVPIDFGDPEATSSLSEQSVLVRGYSAIIVNNRLADPDAFEGQFAIVQNLLSALEGGNPEQAPHGIERVDWNPETRACEVVWANPEPSIPNAIPTLSERTGLIYAHGQQDGVWGLEALDFETGERAFFETAPDQSCDELLDRLQPLEKLAVADKLEELPRSCENSAYAAAQVGPDGTLYQGTWYGMSRYQAQP